MNRKLLKDHCNRCMFSPEKNEFERRKNICGTCQVKLFLEIDKRLKKLEGKL